MRAMIDSGSVSTFINEAKAKSLDLVLFPKNKSVSLANSKASAKITGEVIVDISIDGNVTQGVVIETIKDLCIDVIIGKDFLDRYSKVTLLFGGPGEELVIGAVNEHFDEMKVDPPPLFGKLSNDIVPIATKSRNYSNEDTEFIKNETCKLLKQGIITESYSPWRAQVLVVKNENHKKRMVVDYSRTINPYTEVDAYPLPNLNEMINKIAHYKYYSTFDLKAAYHQVPIKESERKYTAFQSGNKLYEFTRIPFGVTNGVSAFQRIMNKIIETEKLEGTFVYVDNVIVAGHSEEELSRNVTAYQQSAKKYRSTFNTDKSIDCTENLNTLGVSISHNRISPDVSRLIPLLKMVPPKSLKEQKRIVGMFSYYSKYIKDFSEKIRLLNTNRTFPVPVEVKTSFEELKSGLKHATLTIADPHKKFVVETDASDFCIAATLNQEGRPIAFYSRTLNKHEKRQHAVEKEAAAIVESLKTWRHYLIGKDFDVITDQKSVSFMFANSNTSKIKNEKIGRWRLELAEFKYNTIYRQGKDNVGADTFSRSVVSTISNYNNNNNLLSNNLKSLSISKLSISENPICLASVLKADSGLKEAHDLMCHPGVTRLFHYVRNKNLPYSIEQVRQVTSNCQTCAELKPRYFKSKGTLISATRPLQRISIDFKGPLTNTSANKSYLFTAIDEYSRYPFAYACKDTTSKTVKRCLTDIFSVFGLPESVHNDRGSDFISQETRDFLLNHGVATSKTSRYTPQCNGQVEKLNGTIWKAIRCALHGKSRRLSEWDESLPQALHAVRSLLCTATNETPHDRIFTYPRKTSTGINLPTWLQAQPKQVLVKNQTRTSKMEPLVVRADLLHLNPNSAQVRLPSGTETTVSLREIAPCPDSKEIEPPTQINHSQHALHNDNIELVMRPETNDTAGDSPAIREESSLTHSPTLPRRSGRIRNPVDRYTDPDYSSITCINCCNQITRL